jgi:DNA repair exonuclease SbcCD nuclease subunit
MKLLHPSDWHLGRSLFDKKRYDEFEALLEWFANFIIKENIDLLLVAGDIDNVNIQHENNSGKNEEVSGSISLFSGLGL